MMSDKQFKQLHAMLSELLVRVSGPVATKADVEAATQARTQGAMPDDQRAFIDKMIGMHHMPDNEATQLREKNLTEGDAAYQSQNHNGNVSLVDLEEVDAAYFANMMGPYKDKTGQDLRWAGAVGGTTAAINAFRSWGEAWRNKHDPAAYTGPLTIIKAMMGEEKK
jgi:osmotically-inducible protein OsmY